MDRELFIEIGTEEIPASWLPGLTAQIGTAVEARLKDARLSVESRSKPTAPRPTAARVGIGERQTDLEELVTGPPVSRGSRPMARSRPRVRACQAGVPESRWSASRPPGRVKSAFASISAARRPSTCCPVRPGCCATVVPEEDAMGCDAGDGRTRVAVWPPIRWILFLRRASCVPIQARRGRGPRGAGPHLGRGDLRAPLPDRAGGGPPSGEASTTTGRLAENFVCSAKRLPDHIARELDAGRAAAAGASPARWSDTASSKGAGPGRPAVVVSGLREEFLTCRKKC